MSKGVSKGEFSRERMLAMRQHGQGVQAMRDANAAGASNVPHALYPHSDQEANGTSMEMQNGVAGPSIDGVDPHAGSASVVAV